MAMKPPAPSPKDCPRCQLPMDVLWFMGITPEFYVCPQCQTAYDLDTLEPRARVIGGAGP